MARGYLLHIHVTVNVSWLLTEEPAVRTYKFRSADTNTYLYGLNINIILLSYLVTSSETEGKSLFSVYFGMGLIIICVQK